MKTAMLTLGRVCIGAQWPFQWGYFSEWYDGQQRVLHMGPFFVGLKP